MTFSILKPDRGPSPALDVSQIQTNFSVWGTVFSANHAAMNNVNQGDHEAVVLINQSVDPGVNNNYDVVYCKTASGSSGTQPQLFIQIPTFLPTALDTTVGPFAALHMTFNTVNTSGPQYQSFLPGGNILYFGSVTSVPSTITLSPAPSGILIAVASTNAANVLNISFTTATTITSANTFTIQSNATGVFSINWFAIGLK